MARLDAARVRYPWIDILVKVQRRFGAERGANLAAAISMRGFLALFPVLVLMIAVVGFVGGNPETVANDIVDALGLSGSAADTITDAVRTAQRTKVASSVIGIIGLLWTGTGLAASLTAVGTRRGASRAAGSAAAPSGSAGSSVASCSSRSRSSW